MSKVLLMLPTAGVLLALPLAAGTEKPPRKPPAASASATVTVTAKGYASPLEETAALVTVVRTEALPIALPGTLQDLAPAQPGVIWQGDGGLGLNPVIRGLKREQVVLLVDGIKLEALQPVGALAGLVAPALLEGLEVVRGPVSVLHGSGALGGAVNLLTATPDRQRDGVLRGGLRLGASSGDARRQGAFTLKLGRGRHGLALAGAQSRAGDYDSPAGPVAWTGFRTRSGHLAYQVDLGPGQSLLARLQRDEVLDLAFPGSRQPRPTGGDVMVRSPRHARSLASLAFEQILEGAWSPILRAQAHRQVVDRSLNTHALLQGRDIALSDVSFAVKGLNLRAEVSRGAWRGLAGTSLSRWDSSPDSRALTPTGAWNPVGPYRQGRLDSLGSFAQGEWQGSRLGIAAGLRWDRVRGTAASVRLANGTYSPVTASGQSLTRADRAWSGSLGLTWKAAPGLVPYLTLSRAFRAPDIRERFQSGVRADGYTYQGNPQLRPETANHVEAGLKGGKGRWGWQAGLFETRLRDTVAGRTVSPTVRVTENLGSARLRGLDARLEARLGADTRLALAGAWVKGDNLADREPLLQMPPLEGSLSLEHRPATGFTGSLRWRAVDRQDRVATRLTAGRENPTPGFGTLEASCGWRFQPGRLRHEVQLQLRNLGDRTYREHLTEGLSGQEIPAPGRSLALTWGVKF